MSHSHPLPFDIDQPLDKILVTSTQKIYSVMRLVENDGRIHNPSAKYIRCRRQLVDWICEAGEKFHLNSSTLHVAVGYLDKILQLTDMKEDRYRALAAACILLAGKYEEREEGSPVADMLEQYILRHDRNCQFASSKFIHQMEVFVLNKLNWKLTIVTPLHYTSMFLAQGILFENDLWGYKTMNLRARRYMKKYLDFFADLCLQDYHFHQYDPSLLAAAMVVASRRALNIKPLWNPALESVIHYSDREIASTYAHIWRLYTENFPFEASQAVNQEDLTDQDAYKMGLEVVYSPYLSPQKFSSVEGRNYDYGLVSPPSMTTSSTTVAAKNIDGTSGYGHSTINTEHTPETLTTATPGTNESGISVISATREGAFSYSMVPQQINFDLTAPANSAS